MADDVTRLPDQNGGSDETSEYHRQLAEARAAEGIDSKARSLEDLADDGGDQPELFPMGSLPGDDVTPSKLIKRGLPLEITVALSRAEVPVGGGGLFNPDKKGRALVSYLPGAVHEVPSRDGDDDTVTSWKARQDLRVTYVEHANDEAALILKEFEALMALDEAGAGRVLDTLTQLFSSHK